MQCVGIASSLSSLGHFSICSSSLAPITGPGLLHLPPPSGRVCGRCRHQLASSSQYHSISACNDEYQYDPRGSRRDAFSGTIQPVKALSGHPAPRHPTTGFLCTGSSLDALSDPHAAEIAWQREAVEKL
jgi:hypothetical protein